MIAAVHEALIEFVVARLRTNRVPRWRNKRRAQRLAREAAVSWPPMTYGVWTGTTAPKSMAAMNAYQHASSYMNGLQQAAAAQNAVYGGGARGGLR